jgi:hypothetical protein
MSESLSVEQAEVDDGIMTESESDNDLQDWMDADEPEESDSGEDKETVNAVPASVERTTEPEETEDGKEEPAAKKPAPKAKEAPAYDPGTKVKIKVDGEEVEVTLDQAVREYRRRSAADKRFQEASSIRKEAESLIANLKSDPWGALKELGVDPDEAASQRILAKIEEEKLAAENPAELQRRKAQKELDATRAELEAQKKAAEEAENQKRREQIRGKIDKQFTAALNEAKLPPTPYTVARMADVLQRNLREDPRFDATPAELAKLVMEDLRTELVTIARGLGPDQLEEFLGADAVKALRKHDLDRARNPALAGKARRVGDPETPIRRRKADYTDPEAADRALEEWAEG